MQRAWWVGVVVGLVGSLVGYAVARRQRLFQSRWVSALFSFAMVGCFVVGERLLPEYRLLLFAGVMGAFGLVVWYRQREQHQ